MDPLLIYVIVGIFTPGPNNIMASSSSSKIGVIKTLPFMVGVLVGTFVVFSITGFFDAALMENVPSIIKYVGYFGAIYIAFLAYKILVSGSMDEDIKTGINNLFLRGAILTLINPKAIIFGLTVFSLAFSYGNMEIYDLLMFSLILAILCFISTLVWGTFGYLFTKLLSKYYKVFNISMASLLLYSAVLIILDTI